MSISLLELECELYMEKPDKLQYLRTFVVQDTNRKSP